MDREDARKNSILLGVVGSHAYGLNTEKSDIDVLGVVVDPTEKVLSFHPGDPSYCFTEPDATFHEVGRFCELCLKGNPTTLEFLWLEDYLASTEEGEELVSLRDKFLSKRVRNSYIGYIYSQINLYGRGGNQVRKEKNIRHCFRLLEQAENLFSTGKMILKVKNKEEIFYLAKQNPTDILHSIEERLEKLKKLEDVLPEFPDEESIEKFLIKIRKNHF